MHITSDKVKYIKQGSVRLKDCEPPPPTTKGYEAEEGWKMVSNIVASAGGEDYVFPHDQILLVQRNGKYIQLNNDKQRQVGSLDPKRDYLVWYHHLWTAAQATTKRTAFGKGNKK